MASHRLPPVSFVAQGVWIWQSRRSVAMTAKTRRDSSPHMTQFRIQTAHALNLRRYSPQPISRHVASLRLLPEPSCSSPATSPK